MNCIICGKSFKNTNRGNFNRFKVALCPSPECKRKNKTLKQQQRRGPVSEWPPGPKRVEIKLWEDPRQMKLPIKAKSSRVVSRSGARKKRSQRLH